MSRKTKLKPIAVAMGAAFVTSLAGTGTASAESNPFAMSDLSSGYMVAESDAKGEEGKCGEGKCGEQKMKSKEGNCGEKTQSKEGEEGEKMKSKEGKCGEGKCGEKK
jgi:uncharacterized low-complexity protein